MPLQPFRLKPPETPTDEDCGNMQGGADKTTVKLMTENRGMYDQWH
jgi:hypothetical protein